MKVNCISPIQIFILAREGFTIGSNMVYQLVTLTVEEDAVS